MTAATDTFRSALSDRYRVGHELGAGGMATVYQALDLRHDRQVAIKLLHPELVATLGRERFLSEIKTTARLQHPHILPLLDSGEAAGLLYYVMPLVEGESLRDCLSRERQLSLELTTTIARQVCAALTYAHAQGVIHRDIKPENILLQSGHALVADFGIALAVERAGGHRLTQTGMSLGTPHYMSPEQASGDHAVDARTDVYALGVVTYEMLVGEPPFKAATLQGVIARVMTERPAAPSTHRDTVPGQVDRVVLKALSKLPADRYANITLFGEALEGRDARDGRDAQAVVERTALRRVGALGWALAAAGLVAGFGAARAMVPETTRSETAVRRWNLLLPEGSPVALTGPAQMGIWQTALAISPDGAALVYASPRGATTQLVIRRLDQDSSTVMAATEGASYPFFSPDGSTLGFFAGRELRKVSASGGSPTTLAQVDRPTGAVWVSPDSILVFEEDGFAMRWIRASGGDIVPAIRLTTQFGTPDLLPGGAWVVGQLGSGQLALLSLIDTTMLAITRRGVLPVDSTALGDILFGASPRWVSASGHLVFATGDGVLMALPFDATNRQVTGPAMPLVDDVRIEDGFGYAEFALSNEGTFVYVSGNNQLYGRIALLDERGRLDTLPIPRGAYTQLRASPDGEHLAVQQRGAIGGWEVIRFDFATGLQSRIPVEGNYRAFPAAWPPKGPELLIALWDPVRFLFLGARLQPLFGGQAKEVSLRGASYVTFSPNGTDIAFSDWRTGELFIRALHGDTSRTRIPGRGFASNFSPDGRWLAYGDVDGGISVSPVPPTGAIMRAAERGTQPLWSPRGDRLIYRDGRRFYQVSVTTQNGFRIFSPVLIGEGPFVRTFAWNHSIAADGRLVVSVASPEQSRRELKVVTGFSNELRRVAPAASR